MIFILLWWFLLLKILILFCNKLIFFIFKKISAVFFICFKFCKLLNNFLNSLGSAPYARMPASKSAANPVLDRAGNALGLDTKSRGPQASHSPDSRSPRPSATARLSALWPCPYHFGKRQEECRESLFVLSSSLFCSQNPCKDRRKRILPVDSCANFWQVMYIWKYNLFGFF